MTDLFRSALNYLSQTAPVSAPLVGKVDHPLVGTNVEIGTLRIKIRSLIAEGGYALVFSAQDVQGNWFALKRQLAADREAAEQILKEITFLRELSGHPAILRYIQAAQLSPQESGHGRAEFLLLTELCPGSVIDLIQKGPLSVKQVTKIFYAACSAIKHMHAKNPPVTHRDMKIENLLFDATGHVKLCDFGSATTDIVIPDENWSASQRTQLEEELARHTTPMYRAPELLDMYSNFPVGPAQDVWALGCVLFYLCYRKHPFEDSSKLRIINAKYALPDTDTGYNMLHPLIQTTLMVDPRERPEMGDLCERVEALAAALSVDLSDRVEGLELPQLSTNSSGPGQLQAELSPNEDERSPAMSKRSPSISRKNDHDQTVQQASAVFGAIKGQGMSWFKNIKDKTAAVAQTVQSTYGARGPDVTFVTSRLVIAPLADGVPEALAAQAEEAMRTHIMEQARGQFATYNLSNRRLRCDYGNRLSEMPLPSVASGLTPTVKFLLNLCRNMALFLKQNEKNFIVITGPEVQCILVAAALLLYGRLVPRPLSALELVCTKRQPPNLPPSYHRQLDFITTIVSTDPVDLREMVHNRPVILQSLLISPVPLFNRARTGCRPFVEIHAGGTKLWSTFQNYEDLKTFEVPDSHFVELPLGDIPVGDDVQIVLYHARWVKMQNRMQQHLIFSFSFHANFIDPNTRLMELNRGDVDHQADDDSKFGEPLRIALQMKIGERDRGFSTREPPAILNYDPRDVSRLLLVSEPDEYDAIVRHLGLYKQKQPSQQVPPKRPVPPKGPSAPPGQSSKNRKKEGAEETEKLKCRSTPSPQNSFFSSLQWQDCSDTKQDIPHSNFVTEAVKNDSRHFEGQPVQHPGLRHLLLSEQQQQSRNGCDTAEMCERMYGIRVSAVKEEANDDQYKFDYEKETKSEENAEKFVAKMEADLLRLGPEFDVVSCSSSRAQPLSAVSSDGALSSTNASTRITQDSLLHTSSNLCDGGTTDDVLVDFEDSHFSHNNVNRSGMQRNVSAPIFANVNTTASTSDTKFDPFAEFLASTKDISSVNAVPKSNSAATSGRDTPNNQQRPNYNRTHFDMLNSVGGIKSRNLENAFDDLLTSHGFQSSTKTVKSLGEMKRQEEIKEMDPLTIKVRDWTKGKERNIRALLGSLNDILWPGAENWVQPSIGDLLTAQQVKKHYRKACLVIHPDKQVGTENEALARALFTELNDAWSAFEDAGSPSI